jgi:hypothetical protein
MCGWVSRAANRISCRKRSPLTACASSGGRILITTRRPRAFSSARYTDDMPPPSSRSMVYVPERVRCNEARRSVIASGRLGTGGM